MRERPFQLCEEEHRRGRYLKLTLLRTDFIRLSLATCLLLAGCARGDLIGHGMVVESEILQLPSRFVLLFLASLSQLLKRQTDGQFQEQRRFQTQFTWKLVSFLVLETTSMHDRRRSVLLLPGSSIFSSRNVRYWRRMKWIILFSAMLGY
jgi:hypothetical protein